MTDERQRGPRGEGTVYWSESRQRFIAEETVGYNAKGVRVFRRGSGKSVAEAKRNRRKAVERYKAGLVTDSTRVTVGQAVNDWLDHGQGSRVGPETRKKYRIHCNVHVIPFLGRQRLHRLTATQVDEWLADRAEFLATSTLQQVRRCLWKAIRRAQARGLVDRNVVELTECPSGRMGRPSKALTLAMCRDILTKTVGHSMHAYIVVSLLTGVRTEEVRALRWENVNLDGDPKADPPVPPQVWVWRSVRRSGDTKTQKSRRTLALPRQVVTVLKSHKAAQASDQLKAGSDWVETGLIFTTKLGTELDAANVRRQFRGALRKVDGLKADDWTPRELRHSFVSLLSEHGVAIEEIARLVGHMGGSKVTEQVYRHELRPVIQTGATAMDELFGTGEDEAGRTGA